VTLSVKKDLLETSRPELLMQTGGFFMLGE